MRARLPLNNHKRLACVPAGADRKGQNRESIKAATEHQSPLRDCDREEFIRLVVTAGEDPAVTSMYTRDPLRGGGESGAPVKPENQRDEAMALGAVGAVEVQSGAQI